MLNHINKAKLLFLILLVSCYEDTKQSNVELVTKVFEDNSVRVVGSKINGIKEGLWIEYNENGSINRCYTYVHDSLWGLEINFSETGKIISKRHLNGDKLEGEWIVYYDYLKNTIAERGVYKNGLKIGIWEYYLEDGRLNRKIDYNGDSPIILIDNKLEPEIIPDIELSVDTTSRARVVDTSPK